MEQPSGCMPLLPTRARPAAARCGALMRPRLPPAAATLGGVPVAAVGAPADLTYPVEQLGQGADALDKLVKAGRCVRWV